MAELFSKIPRKMLKKHLNHLGGKWGEKWNTAGGHMANLMINQFMDVESPISLASSAVCGSPYFSAMKPGHYGLAIWVWLYGVIWQVKNLTVRERAEEIHFGSMNIMAQPSHSWPPTIFSEPKWMSGPPDRAHLSRHDFEQFFFDFISTH
jgi:hypothetical protein